MNKTTHSVASNDTERSVGRSGAAVEAADTALLARIAAGERAAFEVLYRRYFPRVHRFVDRMTRQPHLVEEVINDTMLVVWRKAGAFTAQSRVSTWIFAIAYRKALKAAQRFDDPVAEEDEFDVDREIHRDGAAPEQSQPNTFVSFATPEAAFLQGQLRAALQDAIGRMSLEHRAVLELTYYHGCPYREIADIMSCPVDTVKTRMFHARRRLRHLIGVRREDLP